MQLGALNNFFVLLYTQNGLIIALAFNFLKSFELFLLLKLVLHSLQKIYNSGIEALKGQVMPYYIMETSKNIELKISCKK